jgi:hypothetical protein
VSPDIQYVDVLTYPTQNLYYSIGNEGTFLTWLNYVISQSSIPLAGSGETRRTRLPKDYAKGTTLLAGDWLRDFAGQAPAHLAETRAATLMGSLLLLEGVLCVFSLISSFVTLTDPETP